MNNKRIVPVMAMIVALLSLTVMLLPLTTLAQQAQESTNEAATKTEFPSQLPKNFASLRAMSLRAVKENNFEEFVRIMEKAYEMRPFDYQVMTQLVAGYSILDKKSKAYNMMLIMQQQGIGVDFSQLPQTKNIRDTESYEYINNLLINATEPYITSTKAFDLPADAVITEAIGYDSKAEQFYFGTVREPGIFVLDKDGHPVPDVPAFDEIKYAVFDIDIDTKRRDLWVSTSAVSQQLGYKSSYYGKNALLKFDVDSGELKQSYQVKPDGQPHGMGNIAVASDGTVYLADLRSPALYKLSPGDKELTVLAIGAALPDIRGIALNEDNNLLYLADQNRGIAFIDLNDSRPYLIGLPEKVNVGGIEGLDYWNGHLLAVQTGIQPVRMMQFLLKDNGRAIIAPEPKDANHPDFLAPNYGVVVGDEYYYMASSHWNAFDIKGNRRPGTSLDPVTVLKAELKVINPEDRMAPNLQDVIRQRQQQQQVPPMLRPTPDDAAGRDDSGENS